MADVQRTTRTQPSTSSPVVVDIDVTQRATTEGRGEHDTYEKTSTGSTSRAVANADAQVRTTGSNGATGAILGAFGKQVGAGLAHGGKIIASAAGFAVRIGITVGAVGVVAGAGIWAFETYGPGAARGVRNWAEDLLHRAGDTVEEVVPELAPELSAPTNSSAPARDVAPVAPAEVDVRPPALPEVETPPAAPPADPPEVAQDEQPPEVPAETPAEPPVAPAIPPPPPPPPPSEPQLIPERRTPPAPTPIVVPQASSRAPMLTRPPMPVIGDVIQPEFQPPEPPRATIGAIAEDRPSVPALSGLE